MEYIVVLVALLFIALLCSPSKNKGKKPATKKGGRSKEVGKIYKTTDGYLSNNPANKKKRNVVVVEQRKKDGAVAVSKIRSKKGNADKNYVEGLTLMPEEHNSITKPSLIETRVIFGVKRNGKYTPILRKDLDYTKDRLTKAEIRQVNKQKGGKVGKNRKTYKRTYRKWKNGFGNKRK